MRINKLSGCTFRRNSWWLKYYKPLGNGKRVQMYWNLGTPDKKEAGNRNIYLKDHMDRVIKLGKSYQPYWESPTGEDRNKATEFKPLFEKFMDDKRLEGMRENTLKLYKYLFDQLMEIRKVISQTEWKPTFNISTLNNDHIRDVMNYYSFRLAGEKGLRNIKPDTVNIRYKCLRSFFRWLSDEGIISNTPKLKYLPTKKKQPSYFSNSQFDKIIECIENHPVRYDALLIDVYKFYRSTGMRLCEPFNSTLIGDEELRINYAKAGEGREVPVSSHLIEIWYKLISVTHLDSGSGDNINRETHTPRYYSRKLLEIMRECNIENRKFHNLRDTYATREWYKTGDIHWVSALIGHSDIKMTQKYTKFKPKNLKRDFPDIAKDREQFIQEQIALKEIRLNRYFAVS